MGSPASSSWSRATRSTLLQRLLRGGGLSGGSLDDEDYFAGQIKFLDTHSRIKDGGMVYGTIDVGQNFTLADGPAAKVTVGPLVGFNFWQETADAYGVRCNPDDVGGEFCGPPGSVPIPFSGQVISNEANWASLRLGAELKVKLWDRLTLLGDAAVLPVAYVWNNDSHLLRADLGPVPNIQDRGTGWGYQLEGAVKLDLTPCWAIGAGVRYWYAEVDGESEFLNFGVEVPLDDFTSERFGVFGEVSYRFATF